MTFTTKIKEEMTKQLPDAIDSRSMLSSYLRYNSLITNKNIQITIENASIARYIFKLIKILYNIPINLTVRNKRHFNKKQIYILEINEKIPLFIKDLQLVGKDIENMLDTEESIIAFLKGIFLAVGSINDPKKGSYHLEFLVNNYFNATLLNDLLNHLDYSSKILKREKKYMVYMKSSESISDFIKLTGAINSLFYFEDIRIYKDHKNMVNRLNNCEQANMNKSIINASKQLNDIKYLKEHDLFDLLDEKTKEILLYREKYPESSYQELSQIISSETEKKVSKSKINHAFIKVRKLLNNFVNDTI